jgi:hypothetical protein
MCGEYGISVWFGVRNHVLGPLDENDVRIVPFHLLQWIKLAVRGIRVRIGDSRTAP